MALRAVPEHPKFAELMMLLSLQKYEALGVLESLWHFTGKFCPRGNVGKFTDLQIEAWLGWKRETGSLVEALLKSGWLDPNPDHRLVVHDWNEHADATTKKQMGRLKSGYVQDMSRQGPRQVQEPVSQIGNHDGPPVPVPVPVPEPVQEQTPPSREMPALEQDYPDGMPAIAIVTEVFARTGLALPFGVHALAQKAVEAVVQVENQTLGHVGYLLESRIRSAQRDGQTINRFWFEDGKWKGDQSDRPASNQSNRVPAATQRVNNTQRGFRDAARARGWGRSDSAAGATGGGEPSAGPGDRGPDLPTPVRTIDAQVRDPARGGSSAPT